METTTANPLDVVPRLSCFSFLRTQKATVQTFLSLVVVECALVLATCVALLFVVKDQELRINVIQLIVALFFLSYFAFDGVLAKNQLQLGVFCFFSALLILRVAAGYMYSKIEKGSVKQYCFLSGLILSIVCELAYGVLLFVVKNNVWKETGSLELLYRASPFLEDQQVVRDYQWFVSTLQLDVNFNISWALFCFVKLNPLNEALNSVAIGVSLLWALLGWYSALNEKRGLFILFLFSSLFLPAFVGYQIWNMWRFTDPLSRVGHKVNIIVAASMTLIVRLIVMYYSIRLYKSFNLGVTLKKKVALLRDYAYLSTDSHARDDREPLMNGSH